MRKNLPMILIRVIVGEEGGALGLGTELEGAGGQRFAQPDGRSGQHERRRDDRLDRERAAQQARR